MARGDIIASDGLIARNNGPWAKDKLSFIDQFVPAALQATQQKLERCYVDLFAGPGKNVNDSVSGEEFDGAALRALRATSPSARKTHFTKATLVNLDADDHAALTARVDALDQAGALRPRRKNVALLNGDANHVVHRVMTAIDTRAYVFVFLDIEAPKQLSWATLQALRMHGHDSVDLFTLFPLDMALNRMLSYRQETVEQSASVLTKFFGTDAWRPLLSERVTDAQSRELRRAILDLYLNRVRALGWKHAIVVRDVKRVGDSGLYKMIYASNHPAGHDIAQWSAEQPRRRDQLDMF